MSNQRPLNQYAISRVLGSTISDAPNVRFGAFSLLATHAESMRVASRKRLSPSRLDQRASKLIATAFEQTRDGMAADRVLVDRMLSRRFRNTARSLGVNASDEQICRRLLAIRKNPRTYGVRLKPTEVQDSLQRNVVDEFAFAVEFALARLKTLRGSSIDDLLVRPALADEFDSMCEALAPGWRSLDYRLGALYIRKTRFIKSDSVMHEQIASLDPREFEAQFETVGTVQSLNRHAIPRVKGVVRLNDQGRRDQYLFVQHNSDVARLCEFFQHDRFVPTIADDFWQPSADDISVSFYAGQSYAKIPVETWELCLIQSRKPAFNLPVAA